MLRYQRSLIDVSDDEINVENEATGQHSNIHISFTDRTMNDNTGKLDVFRPFVFFFISL